MQEPCTIGSDEAQSKAHRRAWLCVFYCAGWAAGLGGQGRGVWSYDVERAARPIINSVADLSSRQWPEVSDFVARFGTCCVIAGATGRLYLRTRHRAEPIHRSFATVSDSAPTFHSTDACTVPWAWWQSVLPRDLTLSLPVRKGRRGVCIGTSGGRPVQAQDEPAAHTPLLCGGEPRSTPAPSGHDATGCSLLHGFRV